MFDRVDVSGASRYGIFVGNTNLDFTLSDSVVHDNGNDGVVISQVADASVINTEAFNNRIGISAFNTAGLLLDTVTVRDNRADGVDVSGSASNVVVRDSIATDNAVHGFDITGSGTKLITNSIASGHAGEGFQISSGRSEGNLAFGNATGFFIGNATSLGDIARDNTGAGFLLGTGGVLLEARSFANATGIDANLSSSGSVTIRNSEVTSNSTAGLVIDDGSRWRIENNTIVQLGGASAIQLTRTTSDVDIRNNVLVTDTAPVISLTDAVRSGFFSDYNLYSTGPSGALIDWNGQVFTDIADLFYRLGFEQGGIVALPGFIDADGADNVAGTVDDDYRLTAASPGIDKADPRTRYDREPGLGGLRANMGAFGNTERATASPATGLEVLSPDGLEKFELGQTVPIEVQSHGLTPEAPVLFVNSGGPEVRGAEAWNTWRNVAPTAGGQIGNAVPIDQSGLPFAVPDAIFNSYAQSPAASAGSQLLYDFDLPDGTYTLRLYFAEAFNAVAGQRVMDVLINGSVVANDLDIVTLAGGQDIAVMVEVAGTATGGNGLQLAVESLVGGRSAVVFGVEIAQPTGVAVPATVALDVSPDLGTTFLPVTTGLALDRYGYARFDWTASVETGTNTAEVRVRQEGGSLEDSSDAPFLIANAGRDFYIDDGSNAGDQYTPTAVGDNANSGKTPDAPMASLDALLRAYDLGPGDRIFVDDGSYIMAQDIEFLEDDSGADGDPLLIVGPTAQGSEALFIRGTTISGARGIEFEGGDWITVSDITIEGGQFGILVRENTASENIVLDRVTVATAGSRGIYVDGGNGPVLIRDSIVRDTVSSGGSGIYLESAQDVTIEGGEFFGNGDCIETFNANNIVIDGVLARDNATFGIVLLQNSGTVLVTGVELVDNGTAGLDTNGVTSFNNIRVENSVATGHRSNLGAGFDVQEGTVLVDNEAYGNNIGFIVNQSTSTGDIAFDNAVAGFQAEGSSISFRDITAWSNGVGLLGLPNNSGDTIVENALIYANADGAIRVDDPRLLRVVSSTLYQPVGDVFEVFGTPVDIEFFNNIL
ncbi:MAG: right-handed parallel beta-helix repeat-containing protein, partial [Pseudomonadota bacterium]